MTRLTPQHLQWLLLSLGVVLATHAANLPVWVIIASVSFGTWRYLLDKYKWALPTFWLLLILTIVMCVGIAFTFKGFVGRDASLALLVVMCSMKLLETKTMRDYMLVIVLAFFLVGNLFLFNQTIATFALSTLPLLLLTATMINISLKTELNNPLTIEQPKLFIIKLAGKLLLQAVPVMLILFLLFPRIPGPLWGLPQDANSGMTGLGDSLSFGKISSLTQSSAIAFRVQFKGAVPANNQLYWRGPVLWHQANRDWLMSSENVGLRQETLVTEGAALQYTMTLEPHNKPWLLMLDMPTMIPNIGKLTHDYSVVANNPVRTRIRYEAASFSRYQLGTQLNERERLMTLQITEGENERTKKLASTWLNLAPEAIIAKALTLYRTDNFVYTLRPPILKDDPVDDFLFNTKRGFCEHYATSFVYLMRAAGLPARIVTGYQGGELNPNGNYLIVRQSDAHAWAEVWLQNKGWVRIDPTAAVSPARIEQGIAESLRNSDELPLLARRDYPLLRKAFLNWDAVNNGWNQWVLGYDDKKQLSFLQKLTGKQFGLQDMLFWMMGIVAVVMVITSYFLLKTKQKISSPAQKCYAQFLTKLKPTGLQLNNGEAAIDFANRAAAQLPHHANTLLHIAERYNALQFSQQNQTKLLNELAGLVQKFSLKQT